MRKFMILVSTFVFLFVFTACANNTTDTVDTVDDGIFRVVLLVNGNLGDMSFFDSANEGIKRLNEDFGPDVVATTIEMGSNQSTWETTLYRVSRQNYDLIICATTQMREQLQRVSKSYPDQKYLIFDTEIDDGKAANYPNVHSIVFRQNEGGFLAGVLAAKMANGNSGMASPVNATGKVGFIGGMRNNIIYDFAVGYAKGIEFVNQLDSSQTSLMTSFVGNFSDSTQAKALANVQYSNQADVIFVAASQAGLGVIDAAETQNRFVIGVDSDQYSYFKDTNPARANLIVTSVLKEVGNVVYDSAVSHLNGELEFGVLVSFGLAEGIVGLADNENYQRLVPEALRLYIDGLKAQIISGELVVTSRFDLSLDQVNQLFETLK